MPSSKSFPHTSWLRWGLKRTKVVPYPLDSFRLSTADRIHGLPEKFLFLDLTDLASALEQVEKKQWTSTCTLTDRMLIWSAMDQSMFLVNCCPIVNLSPSCRADIVGAYPEHYWVVPDARFPIIMKCIP